MKYIFTFIFLIVIQTYSQNSKIEGQVIFDNEDSVKVNVRLIDKEVYKITDQNNAFEFINLEAGVYEVEVSLIGYKTKTKTIKLGENETKKVEFNMEASTSELDEIIILDKQTGLNSKTPYSFTPVKMDRIAYKSSPAGVMGVLREVPGVYGAEFGQGIVKPIIRGLGFSRVATIYQGNKLENQQWGADHGLGVNDLGVKRIEVIKGPASVLYGSGALGGVILIKDDDFYKNAEQISGSAGSSFHSVSQGFRTYASVGQKFENEVFFGADLAYENHADYKSGNGEIIGNSRFNMQTFRFHLGLDKQNFDNRLSVTYNHQNLGIISDDEMTNSNATKRNDRDMQLPFQEVTDLLLSYNQHITSENFETNLHISHHWNDRKEIEENYNEVDLGLTQHNTFYNANIGFETNFLNHSLGIQGNRLQNKNHRNAKEILIPDAVFYENGLYYMLDFDWKSYFIQAAIRYDYRDVEADASDPFFVDAGFILPGEPENRKVNSYFGGWTGSIGVSRDFGKIHKVKMNLSSGFRSPDLAELYSFGQHPGTNRFEVGNANFNREQSLQLDMNYSLTTNRFRLDWSIFGSQIDNYIFFSDTGETQSENDLQIWEYQQVEAELYGSEANLQYFALKNRQLKLNLGAAMVRGNNLDIDEPLTFIPPDNFNFLAKYSFGKLQQTSIFGKLRWVDEQDRPGFNELPTDDYQLVSLGIDHEFNLKNLKIETALKIENVFDENYVDHLSVLRAFNIPSPGRNLNLNLQLHF
ncbi:TonB-dependent receptor [Psychroflexus aestuariivivens]|uniref:TonB-dependent receptor n=1 Tax=Psychroflexus aestuariivivens TaxID=1795040 RepID=UPI000FD6D424|nr:TonB-dependent receptor [Psychroflexus aestuariivivens]